MQHHNKYPEVPQHPTLRRYPLPDGREYHFTDPFAYLEHFRDSPEGLAVMDAQNAFTDAHITATGLFPALHKQFEDLTHSDRDRTAGTVEGGYELFLEVEPTEQRYKAMAVKDGQKQVLIDPNKMEKGTSLSWFTMSPGGDHLAYAVQKHDRNEPFVYLRDMHSGNESLFYHGATFHMDWKKDGSGFTYRKSQGTEHGAPRFHHQKIMEHTMGEPIENDVVLFDAVERGLPPSAWLYALNAEDGQHVLVCETVPQEKINLFVLNTKTDTHTSVPIEDEGQHDVRLAGNDVYVVIKGQQDSDRVVRSPIATAHQKPLGQWQEVAPRKGDHIIGQAEVSASSVVVEYCNPVTLTSHLQAINRDTGQKTDLPVPSGSGVDIIKTDHANDTLQYQVGNALTGRTLYRSRGKTAEQYFVSLKNLDPSEYETVEEMCTSPEGREVLVVFAAAKGVLRQKDAAVLMSCYGGFRSDASPSSHYSNFYRTWMANGQIAAFPYLSGDGPSEQNHKAGMGPYKYRVPQEINAVARHIHESGISNRLGLSGGSNGATMVVSAALQEPWWYGVVEARVGLYDMLEFDTFLDGDGWVTEYGNPKDPASVPTILRYSPYHLLKSSDKKEFALHITSGLNDTGVDAMHSLKLGVARQALQPYSQTHVHIEKDTGHSWGLSADQWHIKYARRMAYIMHALGVEPVIK